MLPLLRTARGRVVNVGSLNGLVAAPFLGAYAASKAALESLSDALRMELAPWGIEVSLIEPGSTASRIWDKAAVSTARLRTRVPRATRRLYAEAWDRFDEVLRDAARRAVPAQTVAAAVVDALTADLPSTRYPLDQGQSLQLRALPDRERDATLLRAFGLSGGGR
jgi:short-subunit dehydrogenase